MFKKEKKGKTNTKLQKGGERIGFSFYFFGNYNFTGFAIFF